MFDWGDRGGSGDEEYDDQDDSDEGVWATRGRFWRDDDGEEARTGL